MGYDVPVVVSSGEKAIEKVKENHPDLILTDINFNLENEGLIRASRTKSEFMMAMSHELRTPLKSIIGFSDLLKNKSFGELNEIQEK